MNVFFIVLTMNLRLSELFYIKEARTHTPTGTPLPQKQVFSAVFQYKVLLGDTVVVSNRGHCGYVFLSRESQA